MRSRYFGDGHCVMFVYNLQIDIVTAYEINANAAKYGIQEYNFHRAGTGIQVYLFVYVLSLIELLQIFKAQIK